MDYFKLINPNLRYLDVSNIDEGKLRNYIVLEKRARVKKGFKFSLDDLMLVRCVYEASFPRDGNYYPYDKKNCYVDEKNPFSDYIISMKKNNLNNELAGSMNVFSPEQINIKHAAYRDTKHFTINSMTSDIDFDDCTAIFSDRPIVIIEPFKEKINDKSLVNINPVDTFFDLHDTRMKVSDKAVILINAAVYNNMIKDEVIREFLNSKNVVIFKGSISLATDVVLLSLGIMPQHEKNQAILVMEETLDHNYDDESYLVKFMNYIEEISLKYLSKSYLHLSEEIMFNRLNNFGHYFPGILHCDTKYFNMEDEKTREYLCDAYSEYLAFLISLVNPKCMQYYQEMIKCMRQEVNLLYPYFELTFHKLYNEFGYVMLSLLKSSGYEKFYSITQDFNELQLKKANKMMIG